MGIDLFLNLVLSIFQLPGKLQLFLIIFRGTLEQFVRFVRIFGFLGMFQITTAKPILGRDLLLNLGLSVFQLFGKLQPFLVISSSPLEQFVRCVRIFGLLGLFQITTAKPILGIDLLLNLFLPIFQLIGNL